MSGAGCGCMKAYWITHEAEGRVRLELREMPRPEPGAKAVELAMWSHEYFEDAFNFT
jgi:hypothetical protein